MQAPDHELVRESCPANFQIGHVKRQFPVQFAKVLRHRGRRTNVEIERMSATFPDLFIHFVGCPIRRACEMVGKAERKHPEA